MRGRGASIRRRPAGLLAGVLAACVLTGCQGAYRAFERDLGRHVAAGDFRAASRLAVRQAEKHASDRSNRVIYNLEAARAAQLSGDLETSRAYFERVHADVRPYLDERAEARVTEALSTTAVNQTTAVYRATPVDRIMATALNAVNCMALGDMAEARVQLNLARDWQDDAVRRLADGAGRAERGLDREGAQRGLPVNAAQVERVLGTHYAGLSDLRGYANYRNPFVSHLRAVFLLEAGVGQADLERARFELREVLAMEPDAAAMVLPDLDRIEGVAPDGPTTWVYVFAGRGPRLEELRIDLPIPVGNVNYVAAAFPRLAFHADFLGPATVEGGGSSVRSVLLADVDAMVADEFRARLPRIIAQEILSAALKAGATYAAREEAGGWGQLLGMIYQAASTSADTRNWSTLPKRIHLARTPTPADGLLTVRVGAVASAVRVRPGASHIVVVTVPTAGAREASVVHADLDPQTRQEMAHEN